MPPRLVRLWLILLPLLVYQIYGAYFEQRTEELPQRRPPVAAFEAPPAGRELPVASPRDPVFTVEVGPRQTSTGSAFSIAREGVWLTARHVVDGCDRVGLFVAPRQVAPVQQVEAHPQADIAVLWTARGVPSLPIADEALRERQAGFHFGYPSGVPGQVASTLIGRRNMRTVGRYAHVEPTIAWAEVARVPDVDVLGGLSGGPALNADGEVVGVTVASSQRRGRVVTTDPSSVAAMLDAAGVRPDSAVGTAGPVPSDFPVYGDSLRQRLTVARVYCQVAGAERRPSPRRL